MTQTVVFLSYTWQDPQSNLKVLNNYFVTKFTKWERDGVSFPLKYHLRLIYGLNFFYNNNSNSKRKKMRTF